MSARTHFTSITSIEPIRDAVASGDDALVAALMARRAEESGDEDEDDGEEDDEFREDVESMIKCRTPPRAEPGCWNYVIALLVSHLGLEPDDDLPINNEDWKHYHVWEEYRAAVSGQVTSEADRLLGYLEDGRPLRGAKIDYDGSAFGWLTPEEVMALHRTLAALDRSVFDDEDLAEFHEGLVDSLKVIADRKATLFMAVH